MKTNFKFYLFAMMIYVLPMILANDYYIDDNGRATTGYTRWGVDGRPLADMLMKLLLLSSHMVDIFPLPLLIGSALLALAFAYYHQSLFHGKARWIAVLVMFSFFANPYLAEVFSYRFDVLTLSCALAISVTWTLLPPMKPLVYFICGTLAIIAIYCLYQIAVNVAVIMVLVMFFYQLVENKPATHIIKYLIQRAVQVIAATVIYIKLIIPSQFSGDHPANHPGIASQNFWQNMTGNITAYWNYIDNTFYKNNQGMTVLLLLLALSLLSASVIAIRYLRQEKTPARLLIAALAVILPLVAFVMIAGNLLVLQQPILVPRALLGVSGFMLFSAALLAWALRGRGRWGNLVMTVPVLYALSNMYIYGNALRQQESINQTIVNQLKNDTALFSAERFFIQYYGQAPRAAVYSNAVRSYPVLTSLIPQYFANWWFPYPYMLREGYATLSPIKEGVAITAESIKAPLCQGTRVARHQDYDLYRYQDRLTVDFTRLGCPDTQ